MAAHVNTLLPLFFFCWLVVAMVTVLGTMETHHSNVFLFVGLGMKLTMFASPKEYFKDQMLTTTMCSVPDNFGYSLLVSTEASTQTYHLPVDPNLYRQVNSFTVYVNQ